MRRHINKGAALGFLAFVALWIVGLAREASVAYPLPTAWHLVVSEELSNRLSRNMVANNLKQIGLAETHPLLVLDQPDVEKIQVEEKKAQLALGSDAFDDDEAVSRTALATHHGMVFDEKRSGIAPERRLQLEISVPTDEFDGLLGTLQEIGQLQSISVQKRDRTREFRQLNAQRQALKQYLATVLKLRGGKQGSVEDELKLEQKIQDIEKELRTLSLQMGDFLGKESPYYVTLVLTEYLPGSRFDRTYAVPQRVANAFVWALGWWLALALVVAVLVGTCFSVWTLWRSPR
jgi:hypothetical protein